MKAKAVRLRGRYGYGKDDVVHGADARVTTGSALLVLIQHPSGTMLHERLLNLVNAAAGGNFGCRVLDGHIGYDKIVLQDKTTGTW